MTAPRKPPGWTGPWRAVKRFFRSHWLLHEDRSLKGILRKARRDTTAIILVVSANFALQFLNVYERYELVDFDHLARAAHLTAATSLDISIVQIDDTMYRERFKSRSPLDPALLETIIRSILAGSPRILAVDIDTSAWPAGQRMSITGETRIPVVWTVEPDGNGSISIESDALFGVPAFQPGPDGRLRRYARGVAIGTSVKCPCTMSFPAAVVAATDPARSQYPEDTKERLIGFGMRRFRKLPASEFLEPEVAKNLYRPAITGKIVFLGGTYHAARDTYVTPLGPESGVEVLAQATQTELTAPLNELSRWGGFCCDVLISMIVLSFAIWFKPVPQLVLSALLSVAIVWTIGEFGYHSQVLFLPLCGAFGGVMVAGLVEIFWCHAELWLRHRDLRRENHRLSLRLRKAVTPPVGAP